MSLLLELPQGALRAEEDLAQPGSSAHPAVTKDGGHAPFRPEAKAAWQAAKRALKPRLDLPLLYTSEHIFINLGGGNGK